MCLFPNDRSGETGAAKATGARTHASGNDCFTVSTGCSFSGGSWSLSSYVLTGGSAGSYSDGMAFQQTASGVSESLAQGMSGAQSDSLYQSGVETAGSYANISYNYTQGAVSTTTSAAQGPGYVSSDCWTSQESNQQSTTTLTRASAATYTHYDGTSTTTLDNTNSSSTAASAPGAVVALSNPESAAIPENGADQGTGSGPGSGAPVPDNSDPAQVNADSGSWLGDES